MVMNGSHAKLRELKTRNEFKNQPTGDTGLASQESLIKIKISDGLTEAQDPAE
jgi:hypothetical protein